MNLKNFMCVLILSTPCLILSCSEKTNKTTPLKSTKDACESKAASMLKLASVPTQDTSSMIPPSISLIGIPGSINIEASSSHYNFDYLQYMVCTGSKCFCEGGTQVCEQQYDPTAQCIDQSLNESLPESSPDIPTEGSNFFIQLPVHTELANPSPVVRVRGCLDLPRRVESSNCCTKWSSATLPRLEATSDGKKEELL